MRQKTVTQTSLIELRDEVQSLLKQAEAKPKRPPFPARWCSQSPWCGPPRWYGAGGLAYCDACWRRLGFHRWYHDLVELVAEEVVPLPILPTSGEKNGVGCPEWLTPGTPDWDLQVQRNGIEDMRERRAAWLAEQEVL